MAMKIVSQKCVTVISSTFNKAVTDKEISIIW
jgi:hypothetical protein